MHYNADFQAKINKTPCYRRDVVRQLRQECVFWGKKIRYIFVVQQYCYIVPIFFKTIFWSKEDVFEQYAFLYASFYMHSTANLLFFAHSKKSDFSKNPYILVALPFYSHSTANLLFFAHSKKSDFSKNPYILVALPFYSHYHFIRILQQICYSLPIQKNRIFQKTPTFWSLYHFIRILQQIFGKLVRNFQTQSCAFLQESCIRQV